MIWVLIWTGVSGRFSCWIRVFGAAPGDIWSWSSGKVGNDSNFDSNFGRMGRSSSGCGIGCIEGGSSISSTLAISAAVERRCICSSTFRSGAELSNSFCRWSADEIAREIDLTPHGRPTYSTTLPVRVMSLLRKALRVFVRGVLLHTTMHGFPLSLVSLPILPASRDRSKSSSR